MSRANHRGAAVSRFGIQSDKPHDLRARALRMRPHDLPSMLVAAVGQAGTASPTIGMSFWTDAAVLGAAGIPSVLFGPTGAGPRSLEEWVEIQSSIMPRRAGKSGASGVGEAWAPRSTALVSVSSRRSPVALPISNPAVLVRRYSGELSPGTNLPPAFVCPDTHSPACTFFASFGSMTELAFARATVRTSKRPTCRRTAPRGVCATGDSDFGVAARSARVSRLEPPMWSRPR